MARTCGHLDAVRPVDPGDDGCHECLRVGAGWVHLRMCQTCGHVGCCDSSPNRHATMHHRASGHPLIRSFEPREDWFWCYPDNFGFLLKGAPPAPSHS
ncbi:MAG: UBP-type zinc finger domain-containing protein [Pseudonocardiaceae bacterium]